MNGQYERKDNNDLRNVNNFHNDSLKVCIEQF